MSELEFLQRNKSWALSMLAKPENELPGTLTYAKLQSVLDETEDKLVEHLGIKMSGSGEFVACYI